MGRAKTRTGLALVLILLVALDILVWRDLFLLKKRETEIYFLDVGQGDSELIIFPQRVKFLIDGGRGSKTLENLSSILPLSDRYIDLVILTHPEIDHFEGLIEVLKHYSVGAFIFNGQISQGKKFKKLIGLIEKDRISEIVLSQGDKILYLDNFLDVLSPNKNFLEKLNFNDNSLVLKLDSFNFKTLFTGDIGQALEGYLLRNYPDLDVDILKVAHHGSKFSSSDDFLKETSPEIAVIGVGKNSYGHPTSEVLSRLQKVGAKIFRTDLDGTIKLVIENKNIKVFQKK